MPTASTAPTAPSRRLTFETAPPMGHRIVLYGPGGIGKTTLADLAPGPVASFDFDDSLGILGLTRTQRIAGIASWEDLRATLHGTGWEKIRTIVIDSATRAEELAVAHTLKTVRHERGTPIARIEDYGYGKGYQFVYETFLGLLGDLDLHVRAGRHVILICHDCVASVPNPQGDDWTRYEPRLQSPTSGKASIRLRVREWADHVLFLGYDVDVREGKGRGSGSRTLYPTETPFAMAKSRRLSQPMVIQGGNAELWNLLMGGENVKRS